MQFLVVRGGEAILKQMVRNTKHTWFLASTAVLPYVKLIEFGIFGELIAFPNICKFYRERNNEITLTFSKSEYNKVTQNKFQM